MAQNPLKHRPHFASRPGRDNAAREIDMDFQWRPWGSCSKLSHSSIRRHGYPGQWIPSKARLALGPFSFENSHRLLHRSGWEGEGEPVDGEGEWRTHRTSRTPVTMSVASAPVLPIRGHSAARPAFAVQRAAMFLPTPFSSSWFPQLILCALGREVGIRELMGAQDVLERFKDSSPPTIALEHKAP